MPTHTDPPGLTPEQRSALARASAHALHAKVDPVAHTAPARAAFLSRFEREVDPDLELTPAERSRRAEHAKKAYFLKMAVRREQARSRRKAEGDAA
jgi:hypothetical protein